MDGRASGRTAALDRRNARELPVVHYVFGECAVRMHEGRRPHKRVDKPLPLIESAAAFIEAIVSVVSPKSVAESEDRVGGSALPIVDFVGPGVRCRRLESMRKPLLKTNSEPVVPTADAVGFLIDGAEIGVRPGARVNPGRVGGGIVGRRAGDGVSERGAEARSVDVLSTQQIDSAAEDSGNGQHHFLRELPLNCYRGLLGIRRLQVWSEDIEGRSTPG